MAIAEADLKKDLVEALDDLPPEALSEVASFVDYQRFKHGKRSEDKPPYRPVALGGILKDIEIGDQDIEEARREMWGRFGDRGF